MAVTGAGERKRRYRHRMAAAEDHADDSDNDHDQQRAHEEIRRDHKSHAGIFHTSKIHDGDHYQDADAKYDGMGLKRRNGRNKCPDPCGNSNGGRENVVGEESCGRHKTRRRTEIQSRDRIRTTSHWIGFDRLPVGEKTMNSSVMMAALTGTIYFTPTRPSGMSRLSAASGPYAAELRPSRPKMGTPAPGPICSARSSDVRMGLPTIMSRMFMGAGHETILSRFKL